MKRRSLFSMLAAAALLLGVGATGANAGTVVTEYGGAFNWSLTSTGGTSPTVTITFSAVQLTSVNNADIGPIDGAMKTLVMSLTQVTGNPNWSWTGSSGAESQTFGASPNQAVVGYALSPSGGPNVFAGDGVLFTQPPITVLTENKLPGYDFSPFSNGGALLLSFGKTGVNIGQDIASGTAVSGTGNFTAGATAVPEPASLALLGIGMTGFLAFRRFIKKTRVS